MSKQIAVIGGGWYGCHVAVELKLHSPKSDVVLFEKNERIFEGISGTYGVRLHAGPHYPRSPATRQNCHKSFEEFLIRYPDLVKPHSYSHYGHGVMDATGQPSKVNQKQFKEVCQEFRYVGEVPPNKAGYNSNTLNYVADIEEPSLVIGEPLRQYFEHYLKSLGVMLICNATVSNISPCTTTSQISVNVNGNTHLFDNVINATSYQGLLPKSMDSKIDVIYQTCVVLIYEQKTTSDQNEIFSFIVMDGWFPCIMPLNYNQDKQTYMMLHGKWTILSSCPTPGQAEEMLVNLDDEFIDKQIRRRCESDMNSIWPKFREGFRYIGWKGTVLAKLKTETEFRSSITFQDKSSGIIYVFPGKINDILLAAREVISLIYQDSSNRRLISEDNLVYLNGGTLDTARTEIGQKPDLISRNTCGLQTLKELTEIKGSQGVSSRESELNVKPTSGF